MKIHTPPPPSTSQSVSSITLACSLLMNCASSFWQSTSTHAMSALAKSSMLISDLNGRDKLTKAAQYGSRFLKYYLMSISPVLSGQLELLEKKNLSGARKVFRLGKFLPEMQKANKAWGQIAKKPLESLIALIGRYSLVLWFLGDHVVWLAKLKCVSYFGDPTREIF